MTTVTKTHSLENLRLFTRARYIFLSQCRAASQPITKNLKRPNQTPFHARKKKIAQIGEASFGSLLFRCSGRFIVSFHFDVRFGWFGESRCDNHRESDGGFRVDLSRERETG